MDTLAARQQMVDQQIRTWEVLDPRVLDAIAAVPREAFVPGAYRELAFADAPLPIGFGQSRCSRPKIQGRILQALGVNLSDVALEIGTGTGYLSACLGLLASSTRSIEIHAELSARAAANLTRGPRGARAARDPRCFQPRSLSASTTLSRSRDRFRCTMRASSGHCAVGGRLFAVVGSAPVMDAILVRRVGEAEWIRESLFETVIDPLINAAAPRGFVF